MSAATVVSQTEFEHRSGQIVEQARQGQTVIVESHGEEQVAVVDILDYRLLRAAAAYSSLTPHRAPISDSTLYPRGLTEGELDRIVADSGGDTQALWNRVIAAYFDGDISLGRAAYLLHLSRFDLTERLNRLNLPLYLGPATIQEAREEFEAIKR